MGNPWYALGKLNEAVESLDNDEEPSARQRLIAAYMYNLVVVNVNDFPIELAAEYIALGAMMTIYQAEAGGVPSQRP